MEAQYQPLLLTEAFWQGQKILTQRWVVGFFAPIDHVNSFGCGIYWPKGRKGPYERNNSGILEGIVDQECGLLCLF